MKITLLAHTRNGDVRIMRQIAELELPPGEFLDRFEIMSPYGPLVNIPFQAHLSHPAYVPGAPVVQDDEPDDDSDTCDCPCMNCSGCLDDD